MTFADLITERTIAVGLEASDLEGVLAKLIERLAPGTEPGGGKEPELLARELASGKRGELVRVNESVMLVLGRSEEVQEVVAALAVAVAPFPAGESETAQAVILLLTPRRLDRLKEDFVPALVRVLHDERPTKRLLAARTPDEVHGLGDLMKTELRERRLVEDALAPLRYRVFPDTPLEEVVDLMVRRELHAVPVVSENLQVMGIISVGDALEQLIRGRRKPTGPGDAPGGAAELSPLTARDVMTRTVLCVSEDQSLIEAANLMVNRDVEQLPVVREGELIGFVTRYAVLRRLFGEEGG